MRKLNERFVLMALAVLIIVGRFTVPGHPLTGYPGLYEALAHVWVGAMLATAWLDKELRWVALSWLAIATVVETIMFLGVK